MEIVANNLCKSYGSFCALDNLSLNINAGEIFGFLGPNGAGKTTTIRLLMGMLVPTNGSATIHGFNCHTQRAEVKRWVGYLPDNPTYQDYLRGEEILRFVGEMHGLHGDALRQRVSFLLERFALTEAAYEFAVNYSLGMKRRLGLACAQIHDPLIYILDEPTNGLDPIAARDVQIWINASAQAGRTIFLSTHLLEMAEKICHRIGIIYQGQLVAIGTPQDLMNKLCPGESLESLFFMLTNNKEQVKENV